MFLRINLVWRYVPAKIMGSVSNSRKFKSTAVVTCLHSLTRAAKFFRICSLFATCHFSHLRVDPGFSGPSIKYPHGIYETGHYPIWMGLALRLHLFKEFEQMSGLGFLSKSHHRKYMSTWRCYSEPAGWQ